MNNENENQWHCAVKNTTTTKTKWYYHLFYDFDGIKLSSQDIHDIVALMKACRSSFILRETAHGYHLIGLTPLSSYHWGYYFDRLQELYPTYHDGQAIRITKKMQDEFIIVAENYNFPYVLNLANLFMQKHWENEHAIKEQWYVLLYYTTNKKNVKNKEVIARNERPKEKEIVY